MGLAGAGGARRRLVTLVLAGVVAVVGAACLVPARGGAVRGAAAGGTAVAAGGSAAEVGGAGRGGVAGRGAVAALEPGTGKYYVVGPPAGGQRDYLYRIAATTLGDGNRYREIFELNRGRRQADGQALTDITTLRPGWVLELPADAEGPGVRTGTPAPPPAPPAAEPARASGGAGNWLVAGGGLALALGLAGYAVVRRRRRPVPVASARAGAPAPRPAVTGDEILTEVDGPAGPLRVRLAGAPAGGVVHPYAWLAPDEPRPEMVLPVHIGESGGWRLWIDLAGTPGVFTVAGPVRASRRRAHAIGAQLAAGGHLVAVVGAVLGSPPPAGWLALPAYPASPADLPPGTGVVISGPLRGAELASARRLGPDSGHRLVPIVVGAAVLRARWSAVAVAAPGEVEAVAASRESEVEAVAAVGSCESEEAGR